MLSLELPYSHNGHLPFLSLNVLPSVWKVEVVKACISWQRGAKQQNNAELFLFHNYCIVMEIDTAFYELLKRKYCIVYWPNSLEEFNLKLYFYSTKIFI